MHNNKYYTIENKYYSLKNTMTDLCIRQRFDISHSSKNTFETKSCFIKTYIQKKIVKVVLKWFQKSLGFIDPCLTCSMLTSISSVDQYGVKSYNTITGWMSTYEENIVLEKTFQHNYAS